MPCIDGFTCRWLVNKWLQELEGVGPKGGPYRMQMDPMDVTWIPTTYGKPAPDIEVYEGQAVLIVDFSYPRKTLEAIALGASWIQVLDHHDTARKQLEDLPYAKFDMTKSGARMLFEFLYPDAIELFPLVLYSEDRDLWKYELPYSRDIAAFLMSQPFSTVHYGGANARLATPESRDLVIAEGHGIRRHVKQMTKALADKAQRIVIGGYTLMAVNDPIYRSETGEEIYTRDNTAIACCWKFGDNNKSVIFSLRAHTDGGHHVGDIARDLVAKGVAQSGGGHRLAGSFEVTLGYAILDQLGITSGAD